MAKKDLEIDINDEDSIIYIHLAGIWYLAFPESPPNVQTLTWETLCVSYDPKTQAIQAAFRNRIVVDEKKMFPNRTLSRGFLKHISIGVRDSIYHFAGYITRVNIWSKVLDKDLLVNITNCNEANLAELPDIIDWNKVNATVEGGVVERKFDEYPCNSRSKQTQELLMPVSSNSMFDAVKICKLFRGNFSFPFHKEEISPFIDKVKAMLPDSQCPSGVNTVWSN